MSGSGMSRRCSARTKWAGLCPGSGKTLRHLEKDDALKWTSKNKCFRHQGTQDLLMREHARRVGMSSVRCPRISTTTSKGRFERTETEDIALCCAASTLFIVSQVKLFVSKGERLCSDINMDHSSHAPSGCPYSFIALTQPICQSWAVGRRSTAPLAIHVLASSGNFPLWRVRLRL